MLELIKLRYGLGEEDFELLCAHLTPAVREYDGNTIGWEEATDAAMTHLLRTVLAKVQKQSTSATAPKLEMPGDTKKLKKHITIVCDRLSKGARIANGGRRAERDPTAEAAAATEAKE